MTDIKTLMWLPVTVPFFLACTVVGAWIMYSTAGPNWKLYDDEQAPLRS